MQRRLWCHLHLKFRCRGLRLSDNNDNGWQNEERIRERYGRRSCLKSRKGTDTVGAARVRIIAKRKWIRRALLDQLSASKKTNDRHIAIISWQAEKGDKVGKSTLIPFHVSAPSMGDCKSNQPHASRTMKKFTSLHNSTLGPTPSKLPRCAFSASAGHPVGACTCISLSHRN